MDEKKTVERLLELLEQKDKRIEELEVECINLEEELEQDTVWTRHRKVEKDVEGYPVPRLELRWERKNNHTWTCYYFLIKRHLLDHYEEIPLGQTARSGSGNEPIFDGKIEMPFRDGAHACYDALHMGLPVYAVLDEKREKIDPTLHGSAVHINKKHKEEGNEG